MNVLINYFIIINIITFILYGLDKLLSITHKERISEFCLLFLSFIFGSLGSIFGMYIFHHKTKKPKFYIGTKLMFILQLIIIIILKINVL